MREHLMLYRSIFFLALICLAPVVGSAADRGETIYLHDGTHVSGVRYIEKKQPDSQLTLQGIVIGKSTLRDVNEKFSGEAGFHEGDAGNSVYILCYVNSKGGMVLFESSGEMGGPDHTVTYAALYSPGVEHHYRSRCGSSELISPIDFRGIKLRSSKRQVSEVMGKPSKSLSNWLLYEYHASEQIKNQQADIVSGSEFKFSKNKLIQISVSKTESL